MNAVLLTLLRSAAIVGSVAVMCGVCAMPANAQGVENLILFERFDGSGALLNTLESHSQVRVAEGEGVDDGNALEVTYEGNDGGSTGIVRMHPLDTRMSEATLCYDVKFPEDFQFVRGGKLHGLAPADRVTGGADRRPDGWSARVNFTGNDSVRTYVYDQSEGSTYGVSQSPDNDFTFTRDQYHAISLHITLNDPDEANGSVHIYVDGERVVTHDGLRIRGVDSEETLIQSVHVSTFHGGSGPSWAPVDQDGDYTTVYAYFDNFAVYEGKAVREAPVTPEQAAEKMEATR